MVSKSTNLHDFPYREIDTFPVYSDATGGIGLAAFSTIVDGKTLESASQGGNPVSSFYTYIRIHLMVKPRSDSYRNSLDA